MRKQKRLVAITAIMFLLAPAFSFKSSSQSNERLFRPFRVDVAMAYVKTQKIPNRYALDFSLEPKYGITDAIWVGLRLESAILIQESPQLADDYQALGIFSAVPTVDYSFVVNEKFRPFIGFGVGSYSFHQFYDGTDAKEQKTVREIGFCPRIGFDYNTFRLGLEYNSIPNGGSYTAIKIGWCMGGGLVY